MLIRYCTVVTCVLLSLSLAAFAQRQPRLERQMSSEETALQEMLNEQIKERWKEGFESLFPARTRINDVQITDATVRLNFSDTLGYMPFRPETCEELTGLVRSLIGEQYRNRPLNILVAGFPIEELVPRAYRAAVTPALEPSGEPPLVRLADPPFPPATAGLEGRHLVVSSSHGWMYDSEKSYRWEWQRARLFNTVEDLHSFSYIVPWLIPMLERAGAVVFHTRERDWQSEEVVLDDGDRRGGSRVPGRVRAVGQWRPSRDKGFKSGLAPYPDAFNPHTAGQVHTKAVRSRVTGKMQWIPRIPQTGEYGVYVSYHASAERSCDARYTVYHLGGSTTFLVNQRIGGNTWVWLGRFLFAKGENASIGRVELDNLSHQAQGTVCADAVKFGGGMGDVMRGGQVSGYPRYSEGARYWLQYAGAPPELTYKMGFDSGYEGPDYTDDFSCRPEWPNYLRGAPYGPNKDRQHPGLGIPIDLLFSFHTDAGISEGIVGTLMIYRTRDQNDAVVFPDGRSRLINRELGDLIQTQLVEDIRSLYTSTWTRRQLRDGDYAETRRGNVPSCLLEMMSHQNFNDMKYGLDPRFQRDTARAMYKGILRFVAQEYGFEPVVQPLPPTHLIARRSASDGVELSWRAQEDPLEPSAKPTGYVVYQRIGQGGFDNGRFTPEVSIQINGLKPGALYSFRVEAVNAGGRSFPSETLAVALGKQRTPRALIVAAFDRIGPPSKVVAAGYQGFDGADRGVGYHYSFGRTGFQYDFDPSSKFVSNDAPGHGASSGEIENQLELGNSFDYVARHGAAFVSSGWTFDSVCDEAVAEGLVSLGDYPLVDWLLGEQRTEYAPGGFIQAGTPDRMRPMFQTFPVPVQDKLAEYARGGGSLFVSGAYVASDLAQQTEDATPAREFLKNVLHIEPVTNHGSQTNELLPQLGELFDGLENLHFAKGLGEDGVYGVELPDAIDPVKGSGAKTVLRYRDRRFSAGVIHEATETGARTLVLGFPFETIVGAEKRSEFLRRALEFLARK